MFEEILHYLASEKISKVGLSLLLAAVAYTVFKAVVARFFEKKILSGIPDARLKQRTKTLERLLFSIGKLLVILWLIFTLLDLIGLDVKALALSAGVAGLALSFGAQSLVKDFIGGLLILLEGQLDLGDYVRIGDNEGLVFTMSSRFVTLIDAKGALIQIPFGTISTIVNFKQVQDSGIDESLKNLIEKIKRLATKNGVLFRFSTLKDENGTVKSFFFFYSTALRKEKAKNFEKVICEAGYTPLVFLQNNSLCFIFDSSEAKKVKEG